MKSTKLIHIFTLLILAILLSSSSCEKLNPEPSEPEPPQLPAATTSGKQTFGCKINGEVFVPNGNFNYPGLPTAAYYTSTGLFGFNSKNLKDFDNWIYIHIYIYNDLYQEGYYFLDNSIANFSLEIYGEQLSGYKIDTTKPRQIQITRFDLDNTIISGEFEFTCVNNALQDTIKVTEGRFDLNDIIIQP